MFGSFDFILLYIILFYFLLCYFTLFFYFTLLFSFTLYCVILLYILFCFVVLSWLILYFVILLYITLFASPIPYSMCDEDLNIFISFLRWCNSNEHNMGSPWGVHPPPPNTGSTGQEAISLRTKRDRQSTHRALLLESWESSPHRLLPPPQGICRIC